MKYSDMMLPKAEKAERWVHVATPRNWKMRVKRATFIDKSGKK